ncbi:MAG: DNA (cytosine-5-)-methyltransferase [Candidatus Altiarchaeales archaeon]|nr:DNA (cytosine-5-)-methyltransferase [Candidatus Altiarchaeales archaeon]MBD3416795.1 DNA (cytosine-5-)-methyltransferase [Candidatus Altiarchaeales archaeon]
MSGKLTAVDLFCGVGGISHGFVRQKISVVAGIDSDSSCQYAFEKNNKSKFINKSIEEISSSELKKLYPNGSVKVLIGCAPCQPFSSYTKKKAKKKGKKDPKWHLLNHFSRLVKDVKPDIISMENVPHITRHQVFKDFVSTLEKHKYNVKWDIVFCPDYGIPQNRKRLVLLASRLGEIELTPPTHEEYVTVRDAISHLPKIKDGERSKDDPLHIASVLSEKNKQRIVQTPEGGGWKDWDESLIADCHKKETGKSYRSVYGRMNWDEPSPTITTQCNGYGNGRFGHPEQNRAISLREAAILQSFPEDYEFIDPNSKFFIRYIARQIGNAVPPKLGEIIAISIKDHVMKYNG